MGKKIKLKKLITSFQQLDLIPVKNCFRSSNLRVFPQFESLSIIEMHLANCCWSINARFDVVTDCTPCRPLEFEVETLRGKLSNEPNPTSENGQTEYVVEFNVYELHDKQLRYNFNPDI
ncbi:hypothetical protein Csa_003497 [Cucumis sativus]|uniref:Uncharacterized protein n=1 Tax=Cucumis sativus TaxID=3659 RepID=A0A0A0KDF8_CUCSA|nr:hypothetical protein Csa_003497 [Cucumis sativus]